jgi:SAM-dependent methyltransferase
MIKLLYRKLRFFGNKYRCEVCGSNIRTYFKFSDSIENQALKNGFQYSFREMETLNYDLCNCPVCFSSDRERLYLLYLKEFVFNKLTKDELLTYRILDFAPNDFFYKKIKSFGVNYFSADLFKPNVDFKIDICNMTSIEDASFNFLICSHILEHVENPNNAIAELYRILKSNGVAIIMVPLFNRVEKTIENASYNTESLKWQHYGQGDHVRLFSKSDFINLVSKNGFKIKELTSDDFSFNKVKLNAISSNSILYICYK